MNCGSVLPANPNFVYLRKRGRERERGRHSSSSLEYTIGKLCVHVQVKLPLFTHPVPLSMTAAGIRYAEVDILLVPLSLPQPIPKMAGLPDGYCACAD